MTRKEKINKAKELLTVKQVRPQRIFRVIDQDGVKRSSDEGWPDEVMPHDIVITIEVISQAEIEAYQKRNGLTPMNHE
jgi:hypothetical protein